MKKTELGMAIAGLRSKNGITQKELAKKCNIDIRTIQRIEAGEVMPRMFTLRLLADALGSELGDFETPTPAISKSYPQQMAIALAAGIVFAVNAIPVVYQIITGSTHSAIHLLTTFIHIVSCIFFFRGFYYFGKQYKNLLIVVSALLALILNPVLNIADLLKAQFDGLSTYIIFIATCLNGIVLGLGLFMESNERKGLPKINLFNGAGFVFIIQSMLLLSTNLSIAYTGLSISLIGNVIAVCILYTEAGGFKNLFQKQQPLVNTGQMM